MGRLNFTEYLSKEQQALLDACIASHNFSQINKIKQALSAQGIEIARSTLHRRVQQLRSQRTASHVAAHQTLVVLLEPSSGKCTFATVNASAAMLEELLSKTTGACTFLSEKSF